MTKPGIIWESSIILKLSAGNVLVSRFSSFSFEGIVVRLSCTDLLLLLFTVLLLTPFSLCFSSLGGICLCLVRTSSSYSSLSSSFPSLLSSFFSLLPSPPPPLHPHTPPFPLMLAPHQPSPSFSCLSSFSTSFFFFSHLGSYDRSNLLPSSPAFHSFP